MKKFKSFCVASILILGMVSLFANSATAFNEGITKDTSSSNVRIQRTNWVNSMGCTYGDTVCVSLWQDNTLVIKLIVLMSTNDISDFPPIHFMYLFPDALPTGLTFTHPVNNAMIYPVTLANGEPAFAAEYITTFNFDVYCENNIYAHWDFRMNFQLVTPDDNGNFYPYPVGSYPGLFDPNLFYIPYGGFAELIKKTKEICCYNETYVCTEDAVVPYSSIAHPDQQHTGAPNPDVETIIAEEIHSVGTNSSILTLAPNPFADRITLHRSDQQKESNLLIFDALGRKILDLNSTELETMPDSIDINTASWPTGVYYFYYFSDNETTVLKTIKH